MRDQYDDQMWQAHKGAFGASVVALFKSAAYAFKRLAARTYDAPWKANSMQRCV